jgi:hypothetical protein
MPEPLFPFGQPDPASYERADYSEDSTIDTSLDPGSPKIMMMSLPAVSAVFSGCGDHSRSATITFDSVSSVSDGPAAVNPGPVDGATNPIDVSLNRSKRRCDKPRTLDRKGRSDARLIRRQEPPTPKNLRWANLRMERD